MITKKIEIKTINYFPILFSLFASAFLITTIFESLDKKIMCFLMAINFFVSNYLFRGKLIVEYLNDVLTFSWKKRPLFSSFKVLQIKSDDLLYASYIDGCKTPDRIKIIGKNKHLTQEISILDKNDLRYSLIEALKKNIDFNFDVNFKKQESLYYKKMNFVRVITLFFSIGFLILFLSTLIWNFISELKFMLEISLITLGGTLISFFIYYASRLYISKFFDPDGYPWVNI